MSTETLTRSDVFSVAPSIRYMPGVFDGERHATLGSALAKAAAPTVEKAGVTQPEGVVPHPFNFEVAVNLRKANPHLSSCLDALRNAMVGQGMKDTKVEERLDKMCYPSSWDDVKVRTVDDMLACGIGFMEVVRNTNGKVAGLFWLPAQTVFFEMESRFKQSGEDFDGTPLFVKNDGPGFHFVQMGGDLPILAEERTGIDEGDGNPRFALFGDRRRMFSQEQYKKQKVKTEIIPFILPTNLWELYGAPRHLSAIPYIELISEALQQRFDFFHNRGVPDFLLFLRGMQLDDDQWNHLTSAMNASSGAGNKGKSAAFQLSANADATAIDLLRMGVDYDIDGGMVQLHDMGANAICSSTRVPQVLAGVQTTGKQGAANETVQGTVTFEILAAKQPRETFSSTLERTLGREEPFTTADFDFIPLTDAMMEIVSDPRFVAADTMANSKKESAAQGGRDFSKGRQVNGQGATG